MATPTNDPKATRSASDVFKFSRDLGGSVENTKVNVGKLYLRQIIDGPHKNQSVVIEPNDVTGLGKTGVSNWAIYDGDGSEANLIANGQGMYTKAGTWNNWFTLVFKVKRFKGSTLQVMGASDDEEENEWAIVGGTGEFAMARGIIKRKLYSFIGNTRTQELTMEFFCRMKVVPAPTKRGPWGSNGGSLHEMEGKSQRLESVTINHGGVFHGIGFSYIDENRQIHNAGIWGSVILDSRPDKTENFTFGPSEKVKEITGVALPDNLVGQFRIITTDRTLGPFGAYDKGTPFSYKVPENETVVGFFAQSDRYVRKIGVYTI